VGTIAIVNQKGACGKTTTAVNLAAFLALQRRVLLVDMDPQGHATLGLSPNFVPVSKTMADLFVQKADRPQVKLSDIVYTSDGNLDLAPADILLSGVQERLAGMIGREDVLSYAFADVRHRYDYVVVDCPPGVGLLSFNALKAQRPSFGYPLYRTFPEPGRYQYRFTVHGNWQSDPLNTKVELCPGGYNSVLLVEARPTEAPLN
jgi:cellulose biosynthesis protein BcsQ